MSEHMNGSPEDATAFSRRMASVSSAAPQVNHLVQVEDRDPLVVLREAALAVDHAKLHARECRSAVSDTRSAFGRALADWNRSEPIQSQEAALRAYVNQSQADRIARAATGHAVVYPGVSRTAKALGGGGHNVKQGGGAAYRRGAVSKAAAMEIEANKLRIAATNAAHARVKLPSQR